MGQSTIKTLTCAQCGKEFQARRRNPHQGSKSGLRFCSTSCSTTWTLSPELRGKGKRPPRKCEQCGKEFLNPKHPQQRYCSRDCKVVASSGAGNRNFKGHITQDERGYLRYSTSHPIHPRKYVHNVIWPEANPNGRCVCCGGEIEIVHHVNENKSDNRLENLQGMCRACHLKTHHHPEQVA